MYGIRYSVVNDIECGSLFCSSVMLPLTDVLVQQVIEAIYSCQR